MASNSEELLPRELPEMIKDLGLAVATANKKLREDQTDPDMRYTVNSAEIELKVAISIDESSSTSTEGGLNIKIFNVNASYSKTFGFKEEASSRIKLNLSAVPKGGSEGGGA